jgi:hypothetical protein
VADNARVGDWLPPEPRRHFTGARPLGVPQRPVPAPARSSPLGLLAVALGAGSLLLLLFSAGLAFFPAAVLALAGLGAGTRARRRAAIRLSGLSLGLSFVAGLLWLIVAST